MINYRGLKVPPLEVESVLNTHPYIEEAQVCFLKKGEIVPDMRAIILFLKLGAFRECGSSCFRPQNLYVR